MRHRQPFLPPPTSEEDLRSCVLQVLQAFLQLLGGVHSVCIVLQQGCVPQQAPLLLQSLVVLLQAFACLFCPGQDVLLAGHRRLRLCQLLSLGSDLCLAPAKLLFYV